MAPDSLYSLADAVAQGTDVDWDLAETTAESQERAAVRQLHLVASLGRAARGLRGRWGPFELRGQIGEGAFGVVHRAWDPRVGREVALKLLSESAPIAQRGEFVHEASLLAAVDHPNVVTVFGADTHDGQTGIWMRFVEGETLKAKLKDRGPFGAEEAAQIGRTLCDALAAVHKAGLVHRDIKAQNVMREVGGRIVLMDFGAGDIVNAARNVGLKGAPAYLAPEVLTGDAPTPQSDIYSLGVLLYHLTSGEFPVVAGSWDELLSCHAQGTRRLLRDARPDLPAWFLRAVDRALSPNPSERPQSAGAMADALAAIANGHPRQRSAISTIQPWVGAAIGAGVIILTVSTWLTLQQDHTAVDIGPIIDHGLAIRVARPQSAGDPVLASADEFVDALTLRLRRELRIRVPQPDTLQRFQNLPDSLLAQATKTGGVLTLKIVRKDSGSAVSERIVVSLALVSAAPGWPTVMTTTIEGQAQEAAALAAQAAAAVGGAVGGNVEIRRMPQSSPRGYSLGRFFAAKLTESDLRTAVRFYDEAAQEAPRFAPVYAARAEAIVLLQGNHRAYTVTQALTLALDDARRAIDLDPDFGGGHTALAWTSFYLGWDWKNAESAFLQALANDPTDATAHHLYADYLSAMGRPKEALAEEQLALQTDPASLRFNRGVGWIHFFSGDYVSSAAALEHTLTLDPGYVHARTLLARVYAQMGLHDRALKEMERVLVDDPGVGNVEILANLHALAGRHIETTQLLEQLRKSESAGGTSPRPYFLGLVWLAMGDRATALDEFERAFREHDSTLVNLGADPRLAGLRADARFVALCGRVNLC